MAKKDFIIKKNNDGSVITVRNVQEVLLNMLIDIDKICRDNHIDYILEGGTALGAIRHGGFIPWDDDLDIAVDISDWSRFIEAMKKDLSSEFYFDSYETDKLYNVISGPWMKVRKKGTYIKEVNTLLANRCKKGDGIFVDVIPYGSICENKFIDELERTVVKINMLFIVFFDNIGLNPIPFKSFVHWFSKKCFKWHKKSCLVSQPVSVPWEKFLHEPVFKKDDVYPFKEYEFEGNKFYSYNNIEEIMKEWYGKNCLKKWDGKKYIETLPVEKRFPKHTKEIYLNSDGPRKKSRFSIFLCILFLVLALVFFNDSSFVFLGLSIVLFGCTLLYYINSK